ncbi:peptidoglycan recognition protein family protein [Schleiferilactobacillus shenzhenensis]|uniref:peptidoglycan recognition protein family protein n=1 Tax=Schleiferilactobacillus shenzhenensis TaxID=1231337 RepID=UPI00068D8116|nr:N-acetylmuramoyl-L-alanine amidase [Schleiferilactobacillus shenzhenensis]
MKKRGLLLSLACAAVLAVAAVPQMAQHWSYTSEALIQPVAVTNQFINDQHFADPTITTKQTTFTHWLPYRHGVGKPEGVVIHETSDPDMPLNEEVERMQTQWVKRQAYVHAFVDHTGVVNIHPTDYGVWGAGPAANARFIQIELVEEHTAEDFAHSINNDAYYVATLLKHYGLPATLAEHTGQGTIWSHNAVTQFLGGTTHTDPTAYFASWHYSMDQFAALVQQKLAVLNNGGTAPTTKRVVQVQNRIGVPLWNGYGANRTYAGRYLGNNTRWLINDQQFADGHYWYKIGANQWIEDTDTSWPNGYGNSQNASSKVITIKYFAGQSIALWNGYGADRQFSGRYLKDGTRWQATKQVYAGGEYWYQVAPNQWVEGNYTDSPAGLTALR